MPFNHRILPAAALMLAAPLHPVTGQESASTGAAPAPVHSLGQPPQWQPYVTAAAAWDRPASQTTGTLLLGVHRPLMNPVTGLIGAVGELYGTSGGSLEGGGARLLARSAAFGLSAGLDLNVGDHRRGRVDFMMSFQTAGRRGGIVGRGTMLRVDWLPARSQTLALGVQLPLGQPRAGRTRPRSTSVWLPAAVASPGWDSAAPPEALPALERVAVAAEAIRAQTTLWTDADVQQLDAARSALLAGSDSRDGDAVVLAYARALAAAFGAAAGGERQGEALARRARAGLLSDVLLPYDTLFGLVKRGDGIRGLTTRAQLNFTTWLRDSAGVQSGAHRGVLAVHARWLEAVENVHRQAMLRWRDSRYVWLPLHLALTPEEHDEQVEVDSLIARAAGRPFTDQNAISYLRSSDLPLEIARSVYAARSYHVLWTHDFTGRRQKSKTVDNLSYEMVANVYFPALTAAVQRYEETGTLPLYMILLDQYFYEPRRGRIWMSMLEDPLNASLDLPGENGEREAALRRRQAELRAAVAASARLQREAAAHGGASWLRRTVKVHVNIMQPSDFSFRSHRIVPPIPFAPDNLMRDHRKAVVYDLTEARPYDGAVFLMGVGIGEHYASETWEDRGYRLRGPAALETRAAIRRFLRQHGFTEEQIPQPLRAVEDTEAAEARMNQHQYVGRALQVHNEVGFHAPKMASVVRAMLYDLAQPGSVVIVPDPLWLSAEWAAFLAGAASRGAQVQVIAPALANAPSPQKPLIALTHEVMSRLLALQRETAPMLRASGGALRVGLFAASADVNDVMGRRREVREGLAREPWIRELIPFDAGALAVLDAAEEVVSETTDATDRATDERPRPPQLHQKTQLVARPGALSLLVQQPGWEDVLASALSRQARETERFAEQLGYVTPSVEESATRDTDTILRGYEAALSPEERRRVSLHFAVGTQNHDPRGLALDGEATVVSSGFNGAAGMVDLFYLMARTTWVDSQAEIDRLLPPPSGFWQWVGRVGRAAF